MDESRFKRLRVGDVVAYEDNSEWPPVHREGPVTSFGNAELTYVVCDFGDAGEMTLTEDDVTRIA